ncbi:hypothetical protein SAMN05443245_3855 [Paraburkholderia fungorum]|uniref:Glycosyl transferase family 2 n=1 Tax=Paraburkholderia fungorum TaxID=134537 RepID=A0A1H1HFU9_9BURK|nr:hypothetical protein [Paraburkholderia fungorum]SDR24262.1 hypothetical protein SAMN05443245_3855 [Paraburkholderia fungorum]
MKRVSEGPLFHAFFLGFYKDNVRHGLSEFISLMRRVTPDFELYFIDNGRNGPDSLPGAVRYIEGDNSRWEFSGWDAGMHHAGGGDDRDVYIFCNDTFCFNRDWSAAESARFVKAFRKLARIDGPALSGEFNSFDKRFTLNGVQLSGWVSTYLFGMSGTLLKTMGSRLTVPDDVLNQLFLTIQDQKIVWGEDIDPILSAHISRWMFPKDAGAGWYKSSGASDELKINKVRAILNEKYLTACCIRLGGKLVRTNPGIVQRAFRKAKSAICM